MDFKEIRKKNNLSQQDLANFLKVDQKTYSNYENKKTEPTIDTLCKLADFYDVSLDYLVGRDYRNQFAYLTEDEKSLLNDYRKLNETNKIKISAELKGFLIAQN